GLLSKVLRVGEGKKLKALQGLVPDINALEPEFERLTDDELRAKTGEYRSRVDRGEELEDLLFEAFATVREAAKRVIGQRHYDVQLVGGGALHFGWVAEMKTGEGKTLVSTLPVYLNAMTGQGVHLVTVNDYLASFHAEWMGSIHRFLGLEVGLVVPGRSDPAHKRAQYAADVTYGTNNEFGFDYLRDNMATATARRVQRGHAYCIVDEIDSILIDEARTPLIISGRLSDAVKLYEQFSGIVGGLERDVDYEVDEEKRTVSPLESGIEKVEQKLGVDNLYDQVSSNLVHQLTAALKAKELYRLDRDYVVQEGEVRIVDEFTGRILEGRRWSEGLHQAVEAKEGVKIKEENQTLATITLQNYFRLYEKLAGMTGTAQTEAAELGTTYGLDVVPIPTNKPVVRDDRADLIYKTEDGKFGAVVDDIVERRSAGQPVLVGTVSVEKSEKLSRLLNKRGVKHEVLNAKQHFREAEIISEAGRLGSVTVATNMAGRGVDIVLGGNPEAMAQRDLRAEDLDLTTDEGQSFYEAALARHEPACKAEGDKVKELGGLYVLATERHESRRIDNQLRGRSGRQGDPGASRFYLSLEDDLMRLFATGAMNWVMGRALPDDVPIEAKMVTKAIERAQTTVEQRNAEIRKNVLKYDQVMNEQRKVIYARRDQILEGESLRDESLEYLDEAVAGAIDTHCPAEYAEEWDVDGLVTEVGTYWPTELGPDDIRAADDLPTLEQRLSEDGRGFYERREAELTPDVMRLVEREVMLRVIDQRWREHLQDMDYLREGINLRAMGQKDPLTEWQREGFDMFGQMMENIARDFVKHVTKVNVKVNTEQQPAAPAPEPEPKNVEYSAPEGPQSGSVLGDGAPAAQPRPNQPAAPAKPIVKSAEERIGRNDPCPCASGKKYKQCHGRRS
ncbi:MAG: preprotein translocase subunit SecA, partial [Actinomycetota bacterium]